MRKSERLRQLELTVVRMEMTIYLLEMTLSNLLESQGMAPHPPIAEPLDNGKWYKRPTETP
jgi:hypothetical protein